MKENTLNSSNDNVSPSDKKSAKVAEKRRARLSNASLTIVFASFVFLILLVALGLTALALFLLEKTGLFVIEGQLQIGHITLFVFLASVIIGGSLVFLSIKIPLKPFNTLIKKMRSLSEGDFDTRLDFGTVLSAHPAFAELSESFNKMAEELGNTELLRGDFINNFSHEFKTPIVSITGFARLLAKGNLSEEERIAYSKAIEEESQRLSSMATNVLFLTRVENQTILTNLSEFNLSEQIRSSILLLEAEWTAKNIDMIPDFDEYVIEANEELLKEVWINLIGNAIKFSEDGGQIIIDVEDIGRSLAVTVSNTGEKIPDDKTEKIFGKFYQLDKSHSTKGNGIGLAIVKRVVALHEGKVSVYYSDGMNHFRILLPKLQGKGEE